MWLPTLKRPEHWELPWRLERNFSLTFKTVKSCLSVTNVSVSPLTHMHCLCNASKIHTCRDTKLFVIAKCTVWCTNYRWNTNSTIHIYNMLIILVVNIQARRVSDLQEWPHRQQQYSPPPLFHQTEGKGLWGEACCWEQGTRQPHTSSPLV